MNTQKQIILIIALTFIFVGGCAAYTAIDIPIRAEDQQQWTRDQSLERGALLFANNCRTCHGSKGQGGVGPALLNGESQFQEQDPLQLNLNKNILTTTLSCGRANTRMPAWLNTNGGSLNAIQIQHLVNFLSAPIEISDDGEATSHWWEEAVEFAHNLNAEVSALVGGDTLGSIARAHGIGPQELAAYNNRQVLGLIKEGTVIKIPPFKDDPDGYTYTVYNDNETIPKIAESLHIGALILADLNGLDYDFDEKRGAATLQLHDPDGSDIPGLAPGRELKLPPGVTYGIQAGDTLAALAERHGVSVSSIVTLNEELLGGLEDDEEIPHQRRLDLPKLQAIPQEGQSLEDIAELHAIEVADLAEANGIEDPDAELDLSKPLTLPAGTRYVVQAGDTWEIAGKLHGGTGAEIAQANDKATTDILVPAVVIQLPQIDAYVVQGQDLAAVAEGYGNVTAESLAEANDVDPNRILYIGQSLDLPEDAFGSAAPDAINPGTACVQYAVPDSAFPIGADNTIPVPTELSTSVQVEGHATAWVVIADGVESEPNKGSALVTVGTSIPFTSVASLHNIFRAGEELVPSLAEGETADVLFDEAGSFLMECRIHIGMQALIVVQ